MLAEAGSRFGVTGAARAGCLSLSPGKMLKWPGEVLGCPRSGVGVLLPRPAVSHAFLPAPETWRYNKTTTKALAVRLRCLGRRL